MSLTGKYSPLNLNSLGSFVQNQGLCINPDAVRHMGTSNSLSYYSLGTTTQNTVLRMLVWSIRAGYYKSGFTHYSELISIGANTIPVLGDSKPPDYTRTASLNPYPNSVPYTGEYTSFGWLRIIPLQAHYEFYINNGSYSDFLYTFNMAQGFIAQSNKAIDAMNAADTYLDGTYSNMNDLITADLAGVSLALFFWGQDLIASGRSIDLTSIDQFGSPVVLLRTLFKNKALTKAVNLALLAAGFSSDEIDSLVIGTEPTIDQQKKLYSAFCIVMGIDLVEVMIGLNCQTKGLRTLADLLDPKYLFPRSYATLTAPTYNGTPGPTNSKTYYLIYTAGEVTSYIVDNYGENLKVILPSSLASACDAFATTMLQIKNVKSMDIERFSQVVQNLETVSDLGVNGTNVPTNQPIRNSTLPLIALGNGDKGRYTTCDFFGAMSGLSYDWEILEGYIKSLQTPFLFRVYHELYLAITWLPGTGSVQIRKWYEQTAEEIPDPNPDPEDPNPPALVPALYTLKYHITGLTITSPGGGYSRGDAPAPLTEFYEPSAIGAPSGARAHTTIDPNDLHGPTGPGSFGQMIGLSLDNSGNDVIYGTGVPAADGHSGPPNLGNPTVQIRIECPPTAMLSVYSTNGENTPYNTVGWPGMNGPCMGYINQANNEISNIASNNPALKVTTNKLYNIFGWHMTLEQNARSLGLRQEKYLPELSTVVTEIYGFMESLNGYATQTDKWGPVQNLEAITDTTKVGGNSMIGSMREVRNAHRLGLTGAEQDNEVGVEQLTLPRVNGVVPTTTKIDPVTGNTITVPVIIVPSIPDIRVDTGGPGPVGPPWGDVISTNPGVTPPIVNPIIPTDPDIVSPYPIVNPGIGNPNPSPWTTLVPPPIDIINIIPIVIPSIITPSQAIDEVVLCNCDCWDHIM
jgi:hypothetical protein